MSSIASKDDSQTEVSSEEDTSTSSAKRRSQLKAALTVGTRGDKLKLAPLRPYTQFARWYSRSEDMFLRWEDTLNMILKYETRKFGNLTEDEFTKKNKRGIRAFEALKANIKYFDNDWPFFKKNPENFSNFHKALDAAVGASRSEDTHSIRDDALLYTALALPEQKLTPEIPPKASKSTTRGHHHIQLSRCLCPVKDIPSFDMNPEKFNLDLKNGVIKYFGWDLPACLWPYDGFDIDNYDENMLRNPALIRVYKHIFTSPTSAMKELPGQTKTRSSQAKMHGMESVTAGSIAYTCVMYRYAISDVDDWRNEEKLFVKSDFFNHIMVYFDTTDPDHDAGWVEDLFEFYNTQIFGTDPRSMHDSDNELRPVPTLDIIRQQRRARLTVKHQAAQAAQDAAAAGQAALSETHEDSQVSTPPLHGEQPAEDRANASGPSRSRPYGYHQRDSRSRSPRRPHTSQQLRSHNRSRSRGRQSYSRSHRARSYRRRLSRGDRESRSRSQRRRSRSHGNEYSSEHDTDEGCSQLEPPSRSKRKLYRRVDRRHPSEESQENTGATGSHPKHSNTQRSPQAQARTPLRALNQRGPSHPAHSDDFEYS